MGAAAHNSTKFRRLATRSHLPASFIDAVPTPSKDPTAQRSRVCAITGGRGALPRQATRRARSYGSADPQQPDASAGWARPPRLPAAPIPSGFSAWRPVTPLPFSLDSLFLQEVGGGHRRKRALGFFRLPPPGSTPPLTS